MNIFIKNSFFIILAICIFQSCKKEDTLILKNKLDENYISIKQANYIAVAYTINQVGYTKRNPVKSIDMVPSLGKTIKSSIAMKLDNEVNAFYVINYEEGGFSLISADRRTPKILAFSDKGYFRTDTLMPGIAGWAENTKAIIKDIRDKNVKYTGQDKIEIYPMGRASKGFEMKNPPVDSSCTDTYEEVGPLLQTIWRQDLGYNYFMPPMSGAPDGKAYTGCVTTALTQIVRYHEYPNWYNYSIMPNDIGSAFYTTGAQEIASLMAFSDSTLPMGTFYSVKYDSNGTYTDAANAVSTLVSYFGYSSTAQSMSYTGAASSIVLDNLRNGKPVIFSGGRQDWLGAYVGGHAWVCDGFYGGLVCLNGGYTGASFIIYLHHNWGTGGGADGFFIDPHFYQGAATYNYRTEVIVNINP